MADLDRPSFRVRPWTLLLLVAGGVAVSLLSHHFLFPAYSWNRDEPVYLWQVAGLRDGLLTPPTGGFPQFFHPWLAGVRDGEFFSQYTLGWPLALLAADWLTGSAAGALALGTALTVAGTYLFAREVVGDERTATLAGIAMLVSPIVVIQSGIFLGYLFTLGLGLLFLTALRSGVRTGRRGRLVVAGALVGWIFMTRPFDAVLWALAGVVPLVWCHRRDARRLLRCAVPLAVGFLPLLVATLAYNRYVTGTLTEFPITAADPLDTFGFGHKRIMPTFGYADYTVVQAIRSSGKQGILLPLFLTGSYVAAALGVWGLWRRRREASAWALAAPLLAFPAGYFFFWGMFVSSPTMPLSGPIYYIPLYAVLSIAAAREVLRLWDERRRTAWIAIGAMVVLTVPVAVNRIDVNRRISEAQVPWKDSSAAAPDGSLVFVWRTSGYLLFLNPYSANTPRLDGRVLWAVDKSAANFELLDAHPDRTPYLQTTSVIPFGQIPNDHPETPTVRLERIRVHRAPAFRVAIRVGGAGRGLRLYARTEDGRVLDPRRRGDEAVLRVGATRGPGTAALHGRGTLQIGLGRGDTAARASRHGEYRLDLRYRVRDGRVELMTPYVQLVRRRFNDLRLWYPRTPGIPSSVPLTAVAVPTRNP